jgi:glycoprotein-N-acetylgalactosamine 3-beta-galactosyltransferase
MASPSTSTLFKYTYLTILLFFSITLISLFHAHLSLNQHVPDAAVNHQQQQPLPFSVQRRHIPLAEESAHGFNNTNAAMALIPDNKKPAPVTLTLLPITPSPTPINPTPAPITPTPAPIIPTPANNEINKPWYGWQPEIHSNMSCSWRKCFEKDHGCSTCRDLAVEIGEPPPPPPLDWVPDVTMLRRMLLDGHDNNGNKWPPLLDKELCEPMGDSGARKDDHQQLLAAVPIHAMPFSEAAATTDSKNSIPQQQPQVQLEGPKIMCLVYTMETAHANSIRAIRETWASGCDGFLAFSTRSDPRIPAISLPHDGPEDYNNMWQKVRSIWRFAATHYADDFDFFFMGGDDLFVLPQNLRNYLRSFSPDDDHFMGRRFKVGGNYFNSGGAGYTLSRSALKKFVSIGLDHPQCHPEGRTSKEDVMIAECLSRVLQIHLEDTRDAQGRERFQPDWYARYSMEWGLKVGKDCCAPDSVSFHYIKKPAMVRHLYSLLYNCNNNEDQ